MIFLNDEVDSPARGAIKLMEPQLGGSPTGHPIPEGGKWFNEARFGMFVHYGLYSLHGHGEWHMYNDCVPSREYNLLADRFVADAFDARALVDLAKRAGAGYVVMGARHHEGYCLWDTATTNFSSVKGPARRDLIREFTDACRQAGLRVGIYYSIMSWQWPAIFQGPGKDPIGWEGMVEETHEQVRELMTRYGRIDYLWYDGCVVPGMGDPEIRVNYWRSRELNAMVRSCQPGILINDRSGLPEDVTTPEQHLTPGPEGRLWECCQTMGESWSWRPDDEGIKDSSTLITQLAYCARFGGNYLLNIGPRGDGGLERWQVERMEDIGRWMAINGDSIRGSERSEFTAARHMIGDATACGNRVFFHLKSWPEPPHRLAGIYERILSARVLGLDDELRVDQRADGTVSVYGLPIWKPAVTPQVLEITVDGLAPAGSPPSLLYQRDTGRHEPAEAPLVSIEDWEMSTAQEIEISAPVSGTFDIEVCLIANEAGLLEVSLDDEKVATWKVPCGEYPVTMKLTGVQLGEGSHPLELQAGHISFAAYLWRLQPVWTCPPAASWQVIGPFPTGFHPQSPVSDVRRAFETKFPPEEEFAPQVCYSTEGGKMVRWLPYALPGEVVNFARVCGTKQFGVCFARAVMFSPRARNLDILLACDWWAKLYVNGVEVPTERDPVRKEQDGADFNDWKPLPARVSLQEGPNIFLVKCHPGSTDNWFRFYFNNPGGLALQS